MCQYGSFHTYVDCHVTNSKVQAGAVTRGYVTILDFTALTGNGYSNRGPGFGTFSNRSGLDQTGLFICGIFIHPDGSKDHLINIKGINNSSIDPNGWRGSSEYRSYEVVSEDFDYMTALISATEELKPSIETRV
jgi:hypothetical protein